MGREHEWGPQCSWASVGPVEQGTSSARGMPFISFDIIQSSEGRLAWPEWGIEWVLSKNMRLKAPSSPTLQTHLLNTQIVQVRTTCVLPLTSVHDQQVIRGYPGTLNSRAASVSSSVFVVTSVPRQFSFRAPCPGLVMYSEWGPFQLSWQSSHWIHDKWNVPI